MTFEKLLAEDSEYQVLYLVCKLLHKAPSEIGKLSAEEVSFLKAGVLWDIKMIWGKDVSPNLKEDCKNGLWNVSLYPTTGSSEVRSGEQVLNFIISSTNMATPGILAVQAGLANLSAIGLRTGSTLTQALSVPAAGLLAVGGAATLGLGLATYQAAKFEDQLKKMQAVSDLSNTDLSRMSNQVKELAMQYGIGATEIASSMQDIGRAGITEASTQRPYLQMLLKWLK